MTQTQRRTLIWSLSGLIALTCTVLWSVFLIRQWYPPIEIVQGRTEFFTAEVQLNASISDVFQDESPHEAPGDTSVQAGEVDSEENEQLPALTLKQQELRQWGLHRGYSISIPSIHVRAPVIVPSREFWDGKQWDVLEEQMQAGLQYGAVQYPHSPAPGEVGSVIIAGHSSPPTAEAEESAFAHLFARLPEVRRGDKISVLVGGTPIVYEVIETMVISPHETSILKQDKNERILKLITCYPIGSTRDRFVVVAKKKANE